MWRRNSSIPFLRLKIPHWLQNRYRERCTAARLVGLPDSIFTRLYAGNFRALVVIERTVGIVFALVLPPLIFAT
jgi:hypothetical protein